MKTPKEISNFYDTYSMQQQKMWHNERHYFLLEQLKKAGIQTDSTLLEIGCGIGTMTNLIAPYVKNGKIISSDISPKSIELAKENNKQFDNIEFIIADSVDFTFPKLNYDFVILFDVLEHIQIEDRNSFLKMLAKHMNLNTQLLINVPAYDAHIYEKEHLPDLMQIIENPVKINELLPQLENHGLNLYSFMTYNIWQRDEYQFYIIKPKQPFVPIATLPTINGSLKYRIKNKIINLLS